MGKVEALFLGVYVLAYFMSKCPVIGGSSTTYCFVAMAVLVVIMLVRRFKYIPLGFKPRIDYTKAAIFVAGAEQPAGWQAVLRFGIREVHVFAAVDDPDSATANWLRRHLADGVSLLKLDLTSEADALAAAQYVQENIGDKVLIGAIYAGYTVPKKSNTIDLDDVRRGIEINALSSVNIAKAFAPLLKKHGGRFVVVSDMAGRIALPSLLSYCMTQSVGLQYANIIRTMLKEYGVSTHVIEPILFNYSKTQENVFYPACSPDDGKVLADNTATMVDHRAFLLVQSMFYACLSEKPKDRYLPAFEDFFMDKFIKFCPPCLQDWSLNYYLNNCITKRKS